MKEFQADKLYQEDALLHKHKQEMEALCEQYESQIADIHNKLKVKKKLIYLDNMHDSINIQMGEDEKSQLLAEQEQIIADLRQTYTEESEQQSTYLMSLE